MRNLQTFCSILALIVAVLVGEVIPAWAAGDSVPENRTPSPARVDFILHQTSNLLWRFTDYYFHNGNYSQAIRLDQVIMQMDPSFTDAGSTGAWLAWSSGDTGLAISMLQEGIRLNPNDTSYDAEMGNCYWIWLKQPDNAIPYYIRAASAYSKTRWNIYGSLAHATEAVGDYQQAEIAWRTARLKVAADPGLVAVVDHNLERVLSKERKIEDGTH